MTLCDNLYKILKEEGGHSRLRLLGGSVIYRAHFPGMPVTPGVCVIKIIKEQAERRIGRRLEIGSIENAKFLNVLSPSDNEEVDCVLAKLADSGEKVKVQGELREGETVFAKVSMTLI